MMRVAGAFLALALSFGCLHTPPTRPDPPSDTSCGLNSTDYDTLADELVSALSDDLSWQKRVDLVVTKQGKDTAVCTMKNIVLDLSAAPVEQGRAQDWLSKQGVP